MQSNNTSCNHWKTGRGSNGNLGAQTKMLLQFWNAWTLVFREKNQRQREYKNDSVSCGIDLSRAILAGRPSKRTGSFLRKKKKKWEGKVPAIRYNHTILSLSTTIPSVLLYEPVGGDASLPGPPLVFGTSCL